MTDDLVMRSALCTRTDDRKLLALAKKHGVSEDALTLAAIRCQLIAWNQEPDKVLVRQEIASALSREDSEIETSDTVEAGSAAKDDNAATLGTELATTFVMIGVGILSFAIGLHFWGDSNE